MWRWILFYLFAFALGVLMATFDWPSWIAIVIFSIVVALMIGNVLYTLYGTTNMRKVENYILRKKKEPIYAYVYAEKFGSKEDRLKAIEAILKKYKQPYITHYYRCVQETLLKNYSNALSEAEKIEKQPLMNYSIASIHADMGNIDKAQQLVEQLPKQWMKEAVLASIANYENDFSRYKEHAHLAVEHARGIQRFSLYYYYERQGLWS